MILNWRRKNVTTPTKPLKVIFSHISVTVPLSVATTVVFSFVPLLPNCSSALCVSSLLTRRCSLSVYILQHITVRVTVTSQETVKAVGHSLSLSLSRMWKTRDVIYFTAPLHRLDAGLERFPNLLDSVQHSGEQPHRKLMKTGRPSKIKANKQKLCSDWTDFLLHIQVGQ